MSTITKEFTKEQLQQIIETDHVQCGEASALARIALASLEAEPVAYIFKHPAGRLFWSLTDENNKGQSDVIPVYTDQPAPVFVPDELTREEYKRRFMEEDSFDDTFRGGWNACRAAIQQAAENAESRCTIQTAPALDSLPKNAESRCSNSPVIPDEVLSAVRKVARIRIDFNDFDGDRRGIGDCLDEAEQELIVTINRHASAIAAAPQQEVK
ncbi:hypothetical protein [Enterobacter roggenkampii]|uniref:hypothetical protein n=1 Tax=Enterobacter roggenkampii TaxID=1812935 RepID=UPI0032AED363